MNKAAIYTVTLIILLFGGCTNNASQVTPAESDPEAEKLFLKNLETHRQWPSFRGYYARGYLDDVNLPDRWDIHTMENVRWKIPIPGLGLSCPVVWDEIVFITTAVSESDQAGIKTGIYGDGTSVEDESVHHWVLYAIHKSSGEVVWKRRAHKGIPEVKRHPKSSHANPTVATDGKHVIAFFGSEGIYCYDFKGNLIWERDFGVLMSSPRGADWAEWEFASSPVIYQNQVIIQADVKEHSFLAALDLDSGDILWKQKRNDWPGWSSPNIYYHQGVARIAVNGYKHRGGYDFKTGKEVWQMSGGGDVPIPTPVQYKDLIFFNSAHGRSNPILAIKTGARGNIRYPVKEQKDASVAWYKARGGSYMQTLLIYKGLLYNMKWNGNLECFDATTGEQLYKVTVDTDSFIASPVAADGKIYVVSEKGEVHIIEAGPDYRSINSFSLGEISLSTPAITEGMIIFRTTGHLIGISSIEDPASHSR